MKTILKIPLGLLKPEEFLQLGNDVSDVVSKSNPTDLNLLGVYNLLEAEMAEAKNIGTFVRKNPHTANIDSLRTDRDNIIGAIINLIKGHKRATASNLKDFAALAIPLLLVYFDGLLRTNNFVKSQRLEMLFGKITSDAEFSLALDALGFKAILNELMTIETALKSKMIERRTYNSEKDTENTKVVIEKATSVLRKLFQAIETNSLVETTLNYDPLIGEINAILQEYNKVLALRRNTNLKNSASKQALNKTAPKAANTSGANTVSDTALVTTSDNTAL